MKDVLIKDDVVAILRKMAQDLPKQADLLRELDAAIGDGDLGITITIGFEAVVDALPGLESGDMGSILMKSGMAFNRKAASTFGALYATMMMRAARVAKGLDAIDAAAAAEMLAAAVQGVRDRGKADVGEKTMLDALVPASEAMSACASAGGSLAGVLQAAVVAAEEGVQATIDMKATMGRARWFSERTQGVQDPGATAVTLMLQSIREYVSAA